MDSEFEILDGVTPLTIDDLVFSSNYARSMLVMMMMMMMMMMRMIILDWVTPLTIDDLGHHVDCYQPSSARIVNIGEHYHDDNHHQR